MGKQRSPRLQSQTPPFTALTEKQAVQSRTSYPWPSETQSRSLDLVESTTYSLPINVLANSTPDLRQGTSSQVSYQKTVLRKCKRNFNSEIENSSLHCFVCSNKPSNELELLIIGVIQVRLGQHLNYNGVSCSTPDLLLSTPQRRLISQPLRPSNSDVATNPHILRQVAVKDLSSPSSVLGGHHRVQNQPMIEKLPSFPAKSHRKQFQSIPLEPLIEVKPPRVRTKQFQLVVVCSQIFFECVVEIP